MIPHPTALNTEESGNPQVGPPAPGKTPNSDSRDRQGTACTSKCYGNLYIPNTQPETRNTEVCTHIRKYLNPRPEAVTSPFANPWPGAHQSGKPAGRKGPDNYSEREAPRGRERRLDEAKMAEGALGVHARLEVRPRPSPSLLEICLIQSSCIPD